MRFFAFRIASVSWLLLMVSVFGAGAKPVSPPLPKSKENSATRSLGPLRVDSAKVHSLYLDGEFDAAIAVLEADLKETRQYRHEDSVFIYKHLGVMYAAQYDTREKGKYYMHRVLLVEPTAKIMDMYASDMIYMIFRNIQEEFEQNRMFMGMQRQSQVRNDTLTDAKPKKDSVQAKQAMVAGRGSSGKKWIWA